MTAWQTLRLFRSTPPALARGDAERTAVFMALEQSEQLMRAAEPVGHAARPLLLFYSLSQAGRAIAAARLEGDAWRLADHGLKVKDAPTGDPLHALIVPQPISDKSKLKSLRTERSAAWQLQLNRMYSPGKSSSARSGRRSQTFYPILCRGCRALSGGGTLESSTTSTKPTA